MNKKHEDSIYKILGIDSTPRRTQTKTTNVVTTDSDSTADSWENAPSGSIFDRYSTYTDNDRSFWSYFRILTIVGILICIAALVLALWGKSFLLPSARYEKDRYFEIEEEYDFEDEDDDEDDDDYKFASQETPIKEKAPAMDRTMYFGGSIDYKYKIHMELDFYNGTGRYYYDKSGASNCMTLKIEESPSAENGYYLELEEYNDSGDYCGIWRGTLEGDTYSGTGEFLGKTMPFRIEECRYSETDF